MNTESANLADFEVKDTGERQMLWFPPTDHDLENFEYDESLDLLVSSCDRASSLQTDTTFGVSDAAEDLTELAHFVNVHNEFRIDEEMSGEPLLTSGIQPEMAAFMSIDTEEDTSSDRVEGERPGKRIKRTFRASKSLLWFKKESITDVGVVNLYKKKTQGKKRQAGRAVRRETSNSEIDEQTLASREKSNNPLDSDSAQSEEDDSCRPPLSISRRTRKRYRTKQNLDVVHDFTGEVESEVANHIQNETKRHSARHSSNEWNSWFCCLCGSQSFVGRNIPKREAKKDKASQSTAETILLCCDTCPLSFHLLCLAENPQLASFISEGLLISLGLIPQKENTLENTSGRELTCLQGEVPRNQENEESNKTSILSKSNGIPSTSATSSEKWSCPKCRFVLFEESKVLGLKKSRFNFIRFLQNTVAPNISPGLEDVDMLSKYNLKLMSKPRSEVTLSQLDDADLSICQRQMAMDCVLRASGFMETFLQGASTSKNERDVQNFLDYGSCWSLLFANLLELVEQESEIWHRFSYVGKALVTQWSMQFKQRLGQKSHSDVSTLALCLVETIEAEKLLFSDSERIKDFKELLNDFVAKGGLEEFIEVNLNGLVENDVSCPNCHKRLDVGSPICKECDFRAPFPLKGIQFRKLTNALVWSNLFQRVGIEVGQPLLHILSAARRCRPWRSIHELGVGDYKLQLYLITHIVFVLSDWGKYSIDPKSLPEEYLFLRSSLRLMVSLDDAELVGEVLQCLSIFGNGNAKAIPKTWTQTSMEFAVAYLLDREKKYGRQGRFVGHCESFYDKIHTTYCAVLGLLSLTSRPNDKNVIVDEKRELIEFFRSVHSEGPVLLRNEPTRPLASYDLLSRVNDSDQHWSPPKYSTFPMFIKKEKRVLLSRPVSSVREVQKQIAEDLRAHLTLNDLPLCAVPSKGRNERELSLLRVGVVGREWVILAHDLAVVLRLDKPQNLLALFCRLISRITLTPPVVDLISAWPPSYPNTKVLQDSMSLCVTWYSSASENDGSGENVAGYITDNHRREKTSNQSECWLGGPLIVASGKDSRTAVALTRHHVISLLEAVDQLLFEETILVDPQVMKAFVQNAFAPMEEIPPVPSHVSLAFPEIYTIDGERRDKPRSKKAISDKKTSKAKISESKKQRHEIENDDIISSTDLEKELENTPVTWASKKRSLRRKTRMKRRGKCYEANNDNVDKVEDSVSGYIMEGTISVWSDEFNRKQHFSNEELLSLPKDSLQLLLDSLTENAELLLQTACF